MRCEARDFLRHDANARPAFADEPIAVNPEPARMPANAPNVCLNAPIRHHEHGRHAADALHCLPHGRVLHLLALHGGLVLLRARAAVVHALPPARLGEVGEIRPLDLLPTQQSVKRIERPILLLLRFRDLLLPQSVLVLREGLLLPEVLPAGGQLLLERLVLPAEIKLPAGQCLLIGRLLRLQLLRQCLIAKAEHLALRIVIKITLVAGFLRLLLTQGQIHLVHLRSLADGACLRRHHRLIVCIVSAIS